VQSVLSLAHEELSGDQVGQRTGHLDTHLQLVERQLLLTLTGGDRLMINPLIEHLYSPRMVEEIKEEEKLEHQTNKQ